VARRIPDLYIEKLLLGELDDDKRRELESDPEVKRRVSELEASNQQVLKQYDPATMARQIQARYDRAHGGEKKGPRIIPFRPRAVALVAAAALVMAVSGVAIFRSTAVPDQHRPDTVRMKGLEPHLRIYRKADGESELLSDGAVASARDLIQVGYVAGSHEYGMIFSIDGRGVVTVHFPESPAGSLRLEQDGETHLSYAYELDDAPDFERFYLLSSPQSFDLALGYQIADEIATTGSVDLPEAFRLFAFTVRKQE
jgi:hypothetical protein